MEAAAAKKAEEESAAAKKAEEAAAAKAAEEEAAAAVTAIKSNVYIHSHRCEIMHVRSLSHTVVYLCILTIIKHIETL